MSEQSARGAVLIVSEDLRLLEQVTAGLHPVYRIHHAETVAQARELLRGTGFDVVIALHPMRTGSGLELLTELASQRHPAIRVLAAEVEEKKVLSAAINHARVSYILRRPWASDVLREIIDSLLELRVRQQSRVKLRVTGDTTGSYKDGITGVFPLPTFFRQVQARLIAGSDATATLIAAEIDDPSRLGRPEGEEDVTNLRLLAACVREASSTVADAIFSRSGARVLALLPQCTEGQAIGIARHAQKNFARADAPARLTASFGLASWPLHATDALGLMDRTDEALQRAQQQGFGQITESLPRVCVVGPLQPLRHAVDLLMRRDDLVLLVFESPSLQDLANEKPSVVLINAQAPRSLVDQLGHLKPAGRPPKVIFATMREGTNAVRARASAVPNSTLISDEARFTPRVVEAVSTALGVKVRRNFRLESRATVTVMLGPETPLQRPIAAALVNISESGALIHLGELVHPGETLRVLLTFGDQSATLPSRVVRLARAEPGWECGVRFQELSPAESELLGLFIAHAGVAPAPLPVASPTPVTASREPIRTTARYLPSKFLRFKLRLSRAGTSSRSYLKVVNLSESGLLATSKATPEVEEGESIDALLLDARGSCKCSAQVVRMYESSSGQWHVALRFIQLGKQARAELGRMLSHCHEAGRRVDPMPLPTPSRQERSGP